MTSTQATAVMIFGALVAVAGVVVLLYARAAGPNRIRAFSVEFELSTPALVVFLAGCALIVTPFLLPDADTTAQIPGRPDIRPQDQAKRVVAATSVDTGVQTCDDGDRFVLEILNPNVSGTVMNIPVRLRNPTPDITAAVWLSELAVAAPDGKVLDPIDTVWDPPSKLDPGTFYEGHVDLRIKPAETLKGVTMHTRPHYSCPDMTARADF